MKSRKRARKTFTHDDLRAAMGDIEYRDTDAFIDEIPAAYKDIDVVMADAKDLVEVRHTLRQIINVKGDELQRANHPPRRASQGTMAVAGPRLTYTDHHVRETVSRVSGPLRKGSVIGGRLVGTVQGFSAGTRLAEMSFAIFTSGTAVPPRSSVRRSTGTNPYVR